mgnify:CR=1 FL=1
MKIINVVGLAYEGRQDRVSMILDSFKKEGVLKSWRGNSSKKILEEYIEPYEFEGQRLLNAIDLEKEPQNIHDSNAIKVMMYDAYGDKHHVGYIPKDLTDAVHKDFKIITQVDVEVEGGRQKVIEVDGDGKESIEIYEVPYGLTIYITDIVDKTNSGMFFKRASELTKGEKIFSNIIQKIVLGLIIFMALLFILIKIF